jgi:hypothetical protein
MTRGEMMMVPMTAHELSRLLPSASFGANGPRRTLAQKLAVAAGSGATAAAFVGAPSAAEAVIVTAMNTPISPPGSSGTTNWDVDGDLTFDFALINSGMLYASFDDTNGGRLVVPAAATQDGIAKLPFGLTIGTGLAAAYKFHAGAQDVNTITSSGGLGGDAAAGGWSLPETGYFGFKFTNGSGTHFGWGEITIDGTPLGAGFTINQAYYESTPNGSIQVGAVPEASQMAALALLSLGAAGLKVWRRGSKARTSLRGRDSFFDAGGRLVL